MAKTHNKQARPSLLWSAVICIFAVYYLQGTLYESGSIISQGLAGMLVLIGGICAVRCAWRWLSLPAFMRWTLVFLVMLTITYIISPKEVYASVFGYNLSTFGQFKAAAIFSLMAFVGYTIGSGSRQTVTQGQLRTALIILAAICVVSYIRNSIAAQLLFKREEVTNNAAYEFLYLLPLNTMVLKRQRMLAIAMLAVVLVFVLAGVKRGAIVCLALMLVYMLIWYHRNFRLRFGAIAAIVVLIAAGGYYVAYTFEENEFLQHRLDQTLEGNSSSRDTIYGDLWEHWTDHADIATKVLGEGSAQTVHVAGNFAHNDWLELLIDNGLVGVAVYLMMFVSALRYMARRHLDPYTRLSMNLWLIFWFATTIFSMGYTSMFGSIAMLLFGYEMATNKNNLNNLAKQHTVS